MKNLKCKKFIILISLLSIFFLSSFLLNSSKNNLSKDTPFKDNFNSQMPQVSFIYYRNATVISDGYNGVWGWNYESSQNPSTVTDNLGNLHVVWEDATAGKWGGTTDDYEIMYANYSVATGKWSNVTVISDGYQGKYWNTGDSYNPSIAADNSGNIHVVWQDDTPGKWRYDNTDDEIMYVNYSIATGKWSNVTIISDGYQGKYWNTRESSFPSIAVDISGNINVVWQDNSPGIWRSDIDDYDIMYVNYSVATGKWSNVTVISDGYEGIYWNSEGSWYPSIAVDILGNLYVFWEDNSPGKWRYDINDYEIMYANYSVATGKWSNITVISDGYQGSYWNTGDSGSSSVVIDTLGNLYVVWLDGTNNLLKWGYDTEIMYANYSISTSKWSNITVISDGYQGSYWNTGDSDNPSIAIDKNSGNLHVVWEDCTDGIWGGWSFSDNEIMYANYSVGIGKWSNATVISDGYQGVFWNDELSQSPSIAFDNLGNFHVVWDDTTDGIWTDYSYDVEIMYTTSSILPKDDNYEDNDNYNSAYNLTSYENEWLHTIDGYANQSDNDWYEIYANCEETIYIDCIFDHEDGNIDIELYYSDDINLICLNDSTDDNESINYKISSTGIYYIKVYGGTSGNSGSNYDLKWFTNIFPNTPEIILPLNYAILTNTSQELKVKVSDPDNDSMTVFFYDESNCALIDNVSGVLNGTIASIIWSDLIQGETYGWYVEVYDGLEYAYSSINYFTIANSCVISGTEPYNFTMKSGDFEVNVSLSFSVSESRFLSFACVINNPIYVLLDNSILFIDITLNDTSNLNWVKISIKFNSNLYKNVKPWWFNETSDYWEELSFLKVAPNIIFFTINHLSTFSLSEITVEPVIIPSGGGSGDDSDSSSSKVDNTMIFIAVIIVIGASIGIVSGRLYSRKRKNIAEKQKVKKITDKIISLENKKKLLLKQERAIKSDETLVNLGKREEMAKKKKIASIPISTPSSEELEREKAELTKIESEVDVKTPKFTCVVHRGVITGNVYICPSCQSFYCDRCAKVLKIKGEKCWYCESEIDISISENDKLKFLEKKAIDLAGEIFNEIPVLKEYIETNKLSTDISKLQEYIFSIIPSEDFEKIDLLDLATEEKKKFITELINLNPEERKTLIEEMLKEK